MEMEMERIAIIIRPEEIRPIRVETLERPQDYDKVDERPWLVRFEETWKNFEKGVMLHFMDDVLQGSVVEYHDDEEMEDEGGLPYLIIHNEGRKTWTSPAFNRTWRIDLIGDVNTEDSVPYDDEYVSYSEYNEDVRYEWFDMIYRATQLE